MEVTLGLQRMNLGRGGDTVQPITPGDDQILEAIPQTFTEFHGDFLFLGIYPLQS